jgi:hypothetical protein
LAIIPSSLNALHLQSAFLLWPVKRYAPVQRIIKMDCPNCGLVNSESAQRCDCGYDFNSKTIKDSFLPKSNDDKIALRKKLYGQGFKIFHKIWHPSEDSLIHVHIFILTFSILLLLIDVIFTKIYSKSLLSSFFNLCFLVVIFISIFMSARSLFITVRSTLLKIKRGSKNK